MSQMQMDTDYCEMEAQIDNIMKIQQRESRVDIEDGIVDPDVLYFSDHIALNATSINNRMQDNEISLWKKVIETFNAYQPSLGTKELVNIISAIITKDEAK